MVKKWNSKLSKLFKEDDTRFLLSCGMKLSIIYLVVSGVYYYLIWIITSVNGVYLESKNIGLTSELRNDFIQNVFQVLVDLIPNIMFFYLLIFFGGIYVGKVLMRPFEIIGNFCQEKTEGKDVVYTTDLFTDYKLLSRFSEYFFDYLEARLYKKNLKAKPVPKYFLGVHGPQFEKVFFFHFFILIVILSGFSGLFFYFVSTEIQESMVDTYLQLVAQKDKSVGYFIKNQSSIFESITIGSILSILVSFVILSFHLYGKVSGAIFAFFSTMRSFMKGNFKARVHLIGYSHIRKYGRAFNKYLDYIERECSIDNNSEK